MLIIGHMKEADKRHKHFFLLTASADQDAAILHFVFKKSKEKAGFSSSVVLSQRTVTHEFF